MRLSKSQGIRVLDDNDCSCIVTLFTAAELPDPSCEPPINRDNPHTDVRYLNSPLIRFLEQRVAERGSRRVQSDRQSNRYTIYILTTLQFRVFEDTSPISSGTFLYRRSHHRRVHDSVNIVLHEWARFYVNTPAISGCDYRLLALLKGEFPRVIGAFLSVAQHRERPVRRSTFSEPTSAVAEGLRDHVGLMVARVEP